MFKNGKNRHILWIVCILLPILVVFISLFIGRYPLTPGEILAILNSGSNGSAAGINPIKHAVVWDMRMPRALMALAVGGALAISGGALQGIFRNPLVDAGLLGVSAGAGFGACLAILLFHNIVWTYVLAFAFGMLAVALSYMTGNTRLLLP